MPDGKIALSPLRTAGFRGGVRIRAASRGPQNIARWARSVLNIWGRGPGGPPAGSPTSFGSAAGPPLPGAFRAGRAKRRIPILPQNPVRRVSWGRARRIVAGTVDAAAPEGRGFARMIVARGLGLAWPAATQPLRAERTRAGGRAGGWPYRAVWAQRGGRGAPRRADRWRMPVSKSVARCGSIFTEPRRALGRLPGVSSVRPLD